jgi:hypothetical protein
MINASPNAGIDDSCQDMLGCVGMCWDVLGWVRLIIT